MKSVRHFPGIFRAEKVWRSRYSRMTERGQLASEQTSILGGNLRILPLASQQAACDKRMPSSLSPSLPLRHAYNSHNICLPALLGAQKAGQNLQASVTLCTLRVSRESGGVPGKMRKAPREGRWDARCATRREWGLAPQPRERTLSLPHRQASGIKHRGRRRCQFGCKRGGQSRRGRARRHKRAGEAAPNRQTKRIK